MIKSWLKTHKKQLGQLGIALGVGIVISLIFFLVFWLTGVFYYDNGFKFNAALFEGLRNNIWLYIVFVIVDAISCFVLCMNPVGSGVFTWLGIALFGANWKCFLATLGGCLLSYIMIDALGRIGGSRLIKRIFGSEAYDEVVDVINTKGMLYVPVIYLLPVFPDDFTCLCVGSMKMSWWKHMLFALFGKSVGIATVVFGVSLLPKDLFLPLSWDKLYNWFILGGVLIAYIGVLFKLFRWLDKKLSAALIKREEARKEKREVIKNEEN